MSKKCFYCGIKKSQTYKESWHSFISEGKRRWICENCLNKQVKDMKDFVKV